MNEIQKPEESAATPESRTGLSRRQRAAIAAGGLVGLLGAGTAVATDAHREVPAAMQTIEDVAADALATGVDALPEIPGTRNVVEELFPPAEEQIPGGLDAGSRAWQQANGQQGELIGAGGGQLEHLDEES